MSIERSYLLGTGDPYPGTWNRPFVTYTPAHAGKAPVFGFADGFFPHDCGGSCGVTEVLKRPHYLKMLRDFGLAWLIPCLERMAAGESFTADELQRIYYAHTGSEMEASSATGHFRFMERPDEDEIA